MKVQRAKILLLSFFITAFTTTMVFAQMKDTNTYSPRDGVINLYGAGGPHTAFIRVGKLFAKKSGVPVKVTFGPERKWTEKAQKNADILWGTSEQSMTAFLETYKEFESKDVEPIYIRRAVIAVQKGNPKHISGFNDLLKPGMKIVVTEGAGVYNTSGTGVWEDVAGRLGLLSDIKELRKNIVSFAKGSGAGFKAFKGLNADAWITWIHWPLTHSNDADVVELSKKRVIYRDLSIVTNEKADPATAEFIKFLNGKEAYEIFRSEGWSK